MEADVALHAPEKWASGGDPRSEKIKYVYSNRRKEREAKSARKASRLQQIKPSRSYDNEIESSVSKEATVGQPPLSPRTKDDSSMRYGERSSRQPGRSSGIPTPTSSPYTSRKNPQMLVHGGGSSETRWKAKERQGYPSRERRKNSGGGESPSPRGVEKGNYSSPEGPGPRTPVQKKSQKQLKYGESSSKLPSRSGIPTPQGIVLEVKDGPSIRYKPSETMLSDVSEPERYDDVNIRDNFNLSPSSPPATSIQFSNNTNNENPSTISERSEERFPAASSPFDQPEPTGVICIQPTRSGIDPDDRPIPTLQQKAPTANAASTPASHPEPDNSVFHNIAEASQRRYGVKHDDIVVGPAAFRQRFHSAGNPSHISDFDTSPTVSDEAAFSSMSLMVQQKAGIRHDDIVVGPSAKRQRANANNSNHQPDNLGLPPLSVHHSLDSPVDNTLVSGVGIPCSENDVNYPHFSQQSPDSGNYSGPPSMTSQKEALGVSSSTLERESRIPKAMDRERVVNVDQKQRGASPGTGIPVFRRERSMDKSQDSVRGGALTITNQPAPNVDDAPLTRNQAPKSPVCLEDDGNRNDRSYGSVDRGKWRPKPGKSGLHRMKRGAKKKEANVSTESGYATDQMPSSGETNESKISPKRGHRIGGSCNDIDQDLEEMVLDSRRQVCGNESNRGGAVVSSPPLSRKEQRPMYSKSRSRSSHNTPVKKQSSVEGGVSPSTAAAKLTMLSTIPVPISQDDPYRKSQANSSNLQQQELPPHHHYRHHHHDSHQTSSPSPASSSSLSPTTQEGPRPKLESAQAATSSSSSKQSTPSDPKPTIQSMPLHQQQPASPSPPSSIRSSAKSLSSKASQKPQSPKPQKKSSSKATSTATPALNSSSSTPIKPRLHRSAEHLVGTTQLSVFHSAEDVKEHHHQQHPDNASDISCSTTSSTKTSKSVPLDYSSPSKKTQQSKSSSRKRMEALATPKRSTPAVATKGRSVSLLRRETERSVAIVRRGSDRAITVSRHDPSVQDLKAATSHKELCQSMASLLNIDNEKAAEMLSTSLSKRRDLVEGLDADAILDYLTHHGVLDPNILVNLEAQCQGQNELAATIQRNSAILKHVEEHGDTAVALFINALRQSGQLHLASSLDTEQRIKPVSGGIGYLDKPRHKGEIVVRLSVEALKILAPREPPSERNVNLSLLSSPSKDHGLDFVDSEDDQVKSSCWCFCRSRKRRNRSSSSKKDKRKNNRYYAEQYQETVFTNDEGAVLSSNIPHVTANTTTAKPVQDVVDFAIPNTIDNVQRYNRTMSSQSDANNSNGSKVVSSSISSQPLSSSSPPSNAALSNSGNNNKTGKEKKKKNSKVKNSGKQQQQQPYVPGNMEISDFDRVASPLPEVDFRYPNQPSYQQHQDNPFLTPSSEAQKNKKSKHKKSSSSSKQQQQGKGDKKPPDSKQIPRNLNLSSSNTPPRIKEGEGIFMEYDPQLELVKLRACHDELASPTRQAGPVGIMVEQWKSSGKHFLVKSDLLCRSIVEDFLTDIIKYFEQDRGTLVLDVISEATSVTVFNICMTKNQVTKLEQDHIDGSLLEKLQEVFMSRLDISKFDIRGVSFCTEVDGNQIKSVLSEL